MPQVDATSPVPPSLLVPSPLHESVRARAAHAGLRHVHVFAFRDLEDPEAGGSEEHAAQVCAHLALAGLDVTLHTGRVVGAPTDVMRYGFRVRRRGGRLGVFVAAPFDEITRRMGPCDGIIEIFHGVPFFAPLWSRKPQIGLVHHVHLGTWDMLLPGPLGRMGELVERFAVPLVYRRRALVTAALSARDEIVEHYHVDRAKIAIAHHGVDPRFKPGGERWPRPLVLTVARMMPQKGLDDLLPALVDVRARVPDAEVVIIGDGPHRERLEATAAAIGTTGWLRFVGRVTDDELVAWYQRAWVVASASKREGFGLTLIEAAASGTPVVATRIAGHLDAVDEGRSGLLVDSTAELTDAIVTVLTDASRRAALGAGALEHAAKFTWAASAASLFGALCDEAERRTNRGDRHS
ncbi:MAG: glycosyltransferase family 4 protein [Actinobacteria bacterium]|nr:MAG: glycosyltransferase family 4 protein [Actinomycetota bacterium]